MLHLPCTVEDYAESNRLPIYLSYFYTFQKLTIAGVSFLTAKPYEAVSANEMKKHRATLTDLTGMDCAFVLEQISAYTKNKLLEEGTPFIYSCREIYLPFLGIVLAANQKKVPAEIQQISFLTQKLLLLVLLRKKRQSTATDIAAILNVSRMSGTRCMDELEALLPSLIQKKGRSRYLLWDGTWIDFWHTVRPVLRDPVVKEYRLENDLSTAAALGGISAVCHYSMLSDNPYPTYAMTKREATEFVFSILPQVPKNEEPKAIVQIVGYMIPFQKDSKQTVDPLTAILSIHDEDLDDPRVEGAIRQIEEDVTA